LEHIINLKIDDNCEMAEVLLDGKYLMGGNFWDFHPDCTGTSSRTTEQFGEFRGYNGLVKAISETFGKKGHTVKLIKEKYNYHDKYRKIYQAYN